MENRTFIGENICSWGKVVRSPTAVTKTYARAALAEPRRATRLGRTWGSPCGSGPPGRRRHRTAFIVAACAAASSTWRETEVGMCDETEDDRLFPDDLRMDLETELLQQITALAWEEAKDR